MKFAAYPIFIPALACVAGPISAQVFDNGDPSGGFGTAILSERDSFNQVADDFDLASNATVSHLQWWGSGAGNTFELRIFANPGTPSNTPLHTVALGSVAGSTVNFGGQDIFEYNADFTTIDLDAGDYLLSIVETSAGDNWFWSASCEDGCEGESWRRADDAGTWDTGNWQFAFVLDVPEPGTGALAGLGVLLLSRRRR